jgi:DNA-directed RNA polymerase subunit RPC12/RpoP
MENEFFTIATFEYTAEAQVMKGRFMSQGIEVFLKDEYTVDVDPMVSHAIGGVKLQVHAKDSAAAIELYNEIREYETDPHGNPIACPECEGERILIAPSKKSIVYLLFPFFEPNRYICSNCNEIFKK